MLRGPSLLPPKDLIFVIDCSRLNPREFHRLMSRLMLLLASQRRRTFRKFSYRGVDLDALLDMSTDELVKLFPARARRRFQRGLKRKPMALIKKFRNACAHFALCGC